MGSVIRATGMMSQLLFEHSLRIRMVAQVAGGSSGKTSGAITPAMETTGSIIEGEQTPTESSRKPGTSDEEESNSTVHTAEASNAQTLVASASSTKGKDKVDEKSKDDSGSSNLVGKINNLMSTVSLLPYGVVRETHIHSRNRTWRTSRRVVTSRFSLYTRRYKSSLVSFSCIGFWDGGMLSLIHDSSNTDGFR
jgi:hypothetical protein